MPLGLMVLSLLLYSGRRVVGPVIDRSARRRRPPPAPLHHRRALRRACCSPASARCGRSGCARASALRSCSEFARAATWSSARASRALRRGAVPGARRTASTTPTATRRSSPARSSPTDTSGRDVIALIDIAKQRDDGRIYAGASSNWGTQTKVDQVPLYQLPVQHDADSLGFYLRTDSLSPDIEPYFNETNPAQYDLFNVKYVLLPTARQPDGRRPTLDRAARRLHAVGGDDERLPRGGRHDRAGRGEPTPTWPRSCVPYLASPARRAAPPPARRVRRASRRRRRRRARPRRTPGRRDASTGPRHRSPTVASPGRSRRSRPAWVMLKESYSPRWTATVDGKPVKTADARTELRRRAGPGRNAPRRVQVPPVGRHIRRCSRSACSSCSQSLLGPMAVAPMESFVGANPVRRYRGRLVRSSVSLEVDLTCLTRRVRNASIPAPCRRALRRARCARTSPESGRASSRS